MSQQPNKMHAAWEKHLADTPELLPLLHTINLHYQWNYRKKSYKNWKKKEKKKKESVLIFNPHFWYIQQAVMWIRTKGHNNIHMVNMYENRSHKCIRSDESWKKRGEIWRNLSFVVTNHHDKKKKKKWRIKPWPCWNGPEHEVRSKLLDVIRLISQKKKKKTLGKICYPTIKSKKFIQKFNYFAISTLHCGTFGDVRDRTAGEELKHSSSHGLRKGKKKNSWWEGMKENNLPTSHWQIISMD